MTIEDAKSKFKNDFPDEIEDANAYFDMAKLMEHEGQTSVAYGLYEMAKDEYTHAEFIRKYLIDAGIYIPSEQISMFDELEERICRKFRL